MLLLLLRPFLHTASDQKLEVSRPGNEANLHAVDAVTGSLLDNIQHPTSYMHMCVAKKICSEFFLLSTENQQVSECTTDRKHRP